jgi:hypothetical protein
MFACYSYTIRSFLSKVSAFAIEGRLSSKGVCHRRAFVMMSPNGVSLRMAFAIVANGFCLRRAFAVEGPLPWRGPCCRKTFDNEGPLPSKGLCLALERLLPSKGLCRRTVFAIERPWPSKGHWLCHQRAFAVERSLPFPTNTPLPTKGLCHRVTLPLPSRELCLQSAISFAVEGPLLSNRRTFNIEGPLPSNGLSRRRILALSNKYPLTQGTWHSGNFAFKVLFPLPSNGFCFRIERPLPSKGPCICHRTAFAISKSIWLPSGLPLPSIALFVHANAPHTMIQTTPSL